MKKNISLFLLAICCTQLSHAGHTDKSGSFSSKKEKLKPNSEKRRKNRDYILDKNILRSITQNDFEEKQRLQAEKIEAKHQKNIANYQKKAALWNKKQEKIEDQKFLAHWNANNKN